jgi:diguanylate cyclase (GGDEF)-like protein
MLDSPAQSRAGHVIPLIALLLAMALLAVAVGAAANDHGRKRDALDRALAGEASEQAKELEDYFQRARALTLVTANNPAYRDFYELPGDRQDRIRTDSPTLEAAQQGLIYLQDLFPGSIGEASFIDRGGADNARAVRGAIEPLRGLSPDKTAAPFLERTLALKAGEVYQALPYVSSHTNEWVISNSAPVPVRFEKSPAIIHFEITVESFRRQAADTSTGVDIAIVEATNGKVIADSRHQQPAGAQAGLGRPGDHRFDGAFSAADKTLRRGNIDVEGHPSAFNALRTQPHNPNRWVVVATAPTPGSSWLRELGAAELSMLVLALLLLGFAVFSFRSSQAQLRRAALSDPLTALGNRRKLVADLERFVPQASEARPLLLGIFDLDGFKSYNDTFGHPAGDALLVRLSTALAAVMKDGGAYRMGGDEFCVLAPIEHQTEQEVIAAAGAALSEHGEGFGITASHGSILLPLETADPTEALRMADHRMYADKNGSRASAGRQATDALVSVLAERYPDIGDHLNDVTELCERVAEIIPMADDERTALLQAASLHDIGKAAVPDAILSKQGPLDEEEWAFMQQHTVIGERILAAAPALSRAAQLVRWSHEHYDGNGYPDRLAGTDIPLGARIIAVCNAFDAMTSRRPSRSTPMSTEGALTELDRCAGKQFDPALVNAFRQAISTAPPDSPLASGQGQITKA